MSGRWHLGALVVRGASAAYSIYNASAFRFPRGLADAASDSAENRSRCPGRLSSSEGRERSSNEDRRMVGGGES